MNIIKKASVVDSEQDANEINQLQYEPISEEKQVENMTIKEIVAECLTHYCCGDCKIIDFCHLNLGPFNLPPRWKLQEDENVQMP